MSQGSGDGTGYLTKYESHYLLTRFVKKQRGERFRVKSKSLYYKMK